MRVLSLGICFFLISAATVQGQRTLSKKEMKEASRIFEGDVVAEPVILSDFSKSTGEMLREGDQLFTIAVENENRGYVLSTKARGRYDYFDYSVYYSRELLVMGVIVTVYRSNHGAAICQRKWLSQFSGYNGGELALGREIDALSGATFSAESVVQDIQRCFALMTGLEEDGIILTDMVQ